MILRLSHQQPLNGNKPRFLSSTYIEQPLLAVYRPGAALFGRLGRDYFYLFLSAFVVK